MTSSIEPSPVIDNELRAFLDKWHARWPEWRIARVFIPQSQRIPAEAWFALLQEFADAAWHGSEAAPGAAKLAWWQDELRGWSKGARRHPLGTVLQKQPAAWHALADALPALAASRDHVRMTSSQETLQPVLATWDSAILQIEATLFGHDVEPHASRTQTGVAAVASLSAHHLSAGADATQLRPLVEALAASGGPQTTMALSRPRRIHHALLCERVRMLETRRDAASAAQMAPISPWRTVWLAWRAARGHSAV